MQFFSVIHVNLPLVPHRLIRASTLLETHNTDP